MERNLMTHVLISLENEVINILYKQEIFRSEVSFGLLSLEFRSGDSWLRSKIRALWDKTDEVGCFVHLPRTYLFVLQCKN